MISTVVVPHMAPYSLCSALLLTRAQSAIWDAALISSLWQGYFNWEVTLKAVVKCVRFKKYISKFM